VSAHLLREHAPITPKAWQDIDEEARERLTSTLAARKLVDFTGPHGWDYSSTNLGRVTAVDEAIAGIEARSRRVLPLVELRAPFTVAKSELRDLDRGAADVDYESLDAAAERIAVAENVAVFRGLAGAGVEGIAEATAHPVVENGRENLDAWPERVAKAVEMLLSAGVAGPYGMALGPEDYTAVVEGTERGGYPLFDHVRSILKGPLVWSPGLQGAIVVSMRGGDFLFESGQDLSVGYDHHSADAVHFYLEESFSFRVVTPEAAVVLAP
jgi:uncharacterized linocin/CFP29 family protein